MKHGALLFVLLFTNHLAYGEDLVDVVFHEYKISTHTAIELGFKPVLRKTTRKDNLDEFRVIAPKDVEGKKIDFATAAIYNNDNERIASLQLLNRTDEKRRRYFTAYVNREVVKRIELNVFCSDSYIYEFSYNLSAL